MASKRVLSLSLLSRLVYKRLTTVVNWLSHRLRINRFKQGQTLFRCQFIKQVAGLSLIAREFIQSGQVGQTRLRVDISFEITIKKLASLGPCQ